MSTITWHSSVNHHLAQDSQAGSSTAESGSIEIKAPRCARRSGACPRSAAGRAYFWTWKRSIVTGPDCVLLNGSRSTLPRPEVEKRTPSNQHRQDIDQDLVDETSLQALTGQVGTEDLQILTARDGAPWRRPPRGRR